MRLRRCPQPAGEVWVSDPDDAGATLVQRFRPWRPEAQRWEASLYMSRPSALGSEHETRIATATGATREAAEAALAGALAELIGAAGVRGAA